MNINIDIKPERLRRSEAAAYLRARYGFGTPGYLGRLAWLNIGPRFQRIGHLCLYTTADLDEWALNRPDGRTARHKKPAEDAANASNVGGGDE